MEVLIGYRIFKNLIHKRKKKEKEAESRRKYTERKKIKLNFNDSNFKYKFEHYFILLEKKGNFLLFICLKLTELIQLRFIIEKYSSFNSFINFFILVIDNQTVSEIKLNVLFLRRMSS